LCIPPYIFALRCARTLAACLELLHGMIRQGTFDLGENPQSVGDGYAVPYNSIGLPLAFHSILVAWDVVASISRGSARNYWLFFQGT